MWWSAERQGWWGALSARQRGRWLTGQLWNCTDPLPGGACAALGLPPGCRYAQAARRLRAAH